MLHNTRMVLETKYQIYVSLYCVKNYEIIKNNNTWKKMNTFIHLEKYIS